VGAGGRRRAHAVLDVHVHQRQSGVTQLGLTHGPAQGALGVAGAVDADHHGSLVVAVVVVGPRIAVGDGLTSVCVHVGSGAVT
jgi:hypothetical protein